MSPPLVSVVIACWNAADVLPETLASALGQTWPNLEIIVVDDGSTDDIATAIAPFAGRIRYEPRCHRGLAAARNEGIGLSSGDYVALLDADDVWHPEKIARQMALAARHPESGLIACDGEEFDDGRVLTPSLIQGEIADALRAAPEGEVTGEFRRAFIRSNPIFCPAQVLFPRRVIDRIGSFVDSAAQDYDYYLRVAAEYPVTVHRDVLVGWRFRPDSMSGPGGDRQLRWAIDTLPVVKAYRQRCRPEDRALVDARIRGLVRDVGRGLIRGERRSGSLPGGSAFWSLLVRNPPPMSDLIRLLAFWLRNLGRVIAGRVLRRLPARPAIDRLRNFGTVERKSPDLDRLVPPGSRVERIATGFAFSEGPVWMPGGYLLCGDLPNNVIWRWGPGGKLSIVRRRSGYAAADRPPGAAMGSNGMTLDNDGRLTVCEPGDHRVTRTEADGSITVLGDSYEGKRLNSPNDVVCRRSDGSIYFTDPPHGLLGEDLDPAKELDFNGIYRVAGGRIDLLSRAMNRPNGIAFSPDEKWLYVSNSDPRRKLWMRFAVHPDGSLADAAVLLDLTHVEGQAPDGLKVDVEGNLYLTGPGGLWIVAPSGKILGMIRTRQEPSNAAWGGDDWSTLFLTAPNELYRIRLGVRGTR